MATLAPSSAASLPARTLQELHAVRRRHDSQIGYPEEQPVLDHAGNALQRKGEDFRLLNVAEGAVEDEIALIGEERRSLLAQALSDLALASSLVRHGLDRAAGGGKAEGHHFHGERKP